MGDCMDDNEKIGKLQGMLMEAYVDYRSKTQTTSKPE